MRNRGQVLDNGAVANCHIKNQPTATSKISQLPHRNLLKRLIFNKLFVFLLRFFLTILDGE